MGKIPEYHRRSFQSAADPSKINDAGMGFQAAGAIGNATFNAGAELAIKHKQIEEKEFLAQKGLEYELEVSEAYAEHTKKYQGDPLNKYADFEEQLTEIKQSYADLAPTGVARKLFNDSTNMMNMRLEANNSQWESQRVAINAGERAQASLETVQTQALRVADPRQLEALIAKGDALLIPLNDTHPPEKVEEARRKFRFNAAMNSFEGMIMDGQFNTAENLLDSKKYDEPLGDDGIKRLTKMIATGKASRDRGKADLSRLKIINPYGWVKKNQIGYGVFQMEGGEAAIVKRQNFRNDMKAQHGVELPFFSPDELKGFKSEFFEGENVNNKDRIEFLEMVEKMPIIDSQKVYEDMGVPKEVGFFKDFHTPQAQELYVQAAISKDIKNTSDVMASDIKASADNSSIGKAMISASTSIASNSAFRQRTQNMLNIMERVSTLKNDAGAGPKFFDENYHSINDGDMGLFIPKKNNPENIEDNLKDMKAKYIESKIKGLTYGDAHHKRSYLEDYSMWLNGTNGPVLINTQTGKIVPGFNDNLDFTALSKPLKNSFEGYSMKTPKVKEGGYGYEMEAEPTRKTVESRRYKYGGGGGYGEIESPVLSKKDKKLTGNTKKMKATK